MTLPELSELDLHEYWGRFVFSVYSYTMANPESEFRAYLRQYTSQPTLVATCVKFCGDCHGPTFKADLREVANHLVCATCFSNYAECSECNTKALSRMLATIRPEYVVCAHCRQARYSYCSTCDRYYLSDDHDAIEDHKHICCESPQLEFEVAGIKNDTRTELVIAAGVISETGIQSIRSQLVERANSVWSDTSEGERLYDLWHSVAANFAEPVGDKWQAKSGNFTKRLSSYVYKNYQLKIPPQLLTSIGNTARDHSKGATFNVEFTRKLNMTAAEFSHSGSCWWSSGYGNSRCALKTNGGFGIRTFDQNGDVDGRAWVMPLKKSLGGFAPTFNTSTPDAWAVFNGYHALSGYTPARILAQMTGATYKRISLATGIMSINGGSAYLIGPEETVNGYASNTVAMTLTPHAELFHSEQRELVAS